MRYLRIILIPVLQGAFAVALMSEYPSMIYFIILFAIKELYMALMGLYLIKKDKGENGAKCHGKLWTAVINFGCFALLAFTDMSYFYSYILIALMMAVMIFSLIMNVRFHISVLRDKELRKIKKRYVLIFMLFLIAYILIGGTVPYINNPELDGKYAEDFSAEDYYGDAVGADRAAIITDNGQALEERIRLIEQAEDRIVLSTFSFCADTSGKQMLAALKAAAERGVRIQILVDGFNSWLNMEGNPYFISLAVYDNVEIKLYNKLNPLVPWKAMSRMHDKYIIADEQLYITGGRNTFDYFLGDQKGYKNYDMDVLVYNTGSDESSVYEVLEYLEQVWEMDCCKLWHDNNILDRIQPSVKKAAGELDEIYALMKEEHAEWFQEIDYSDITVETDKISLLSGTANIYAKEPRVFYGLCRLMENAEENIIIHTPYIMCDELMYEALTDVCSADADVVLMTNSAENNGNPFGSVDYVLHKKEILDIGMQVLEYDGKCSYHGKCIAIDDDISIVGSFNMDMKSTYQSTETMMVIDSEELNEQLRNVMEEYHKDASEAVYDENEIDSLFSDDVSLKKRIERGIIKIIDPFLRFLM